MMPTLFLLFSHTLTKAQIDDAKESLGINKFVALPENLQTYWSNVPPEPDDIREHLQPIFVWLEVQAELGDYVLVQGDFGAVYLTVNFARKQGLMPIYSTTRRDVNENRLADGSVEKQSQFRHVRYRRYAQEC